MKEIQEKSMLVRVSRRFELPRAWVVGSWLYVNVEDFPNIAHITLLSMLITGFSFRAIGRWISRAISHELVAYFFLETSPQFKISIHVLSPNKKAKISWCLCSWIKHSNFCSKRPRFQNFCRRACPWTPLETAASNARKLWQIITCVSQPLQLYVTWMSSSNFLLTISIHIDKRKRSQELIKWSPKELNALIFYRILNEISQKNLFIFLLTL